MKRSWISVAVAVAVLGIAAPAVQAQGGGPPPGGMRGGGARMLQMLMKDITLDKAQQTKFDAIQAKYAMELPPMTQGERPDSAAMAKRREIMTKQQGEIRAILTADQQKTFDANRTEMQDRMRRQEN